MPSVIISREKAVWSPDSDKEACDFGDCENPPEWLMEYSIHCPHDGTTYAICTGHQGLSEKYFASGTRTYVCTACLQRSEVPNEIYSVRFERI